jgi:hypothetical protein
VYESTGVLNQNQWNTNVSSRFYKNLTLFTLYVLNFAKSNTDGPATFPSNPFDDTVDYGPSVLDERHRFVLGAAIVAPHGVQISPYVVARSGTPFNITTGTDMNGDAVLTERPGFSGPLSTTAALLTRFGALDPNPPLGEEILPRNYGRAPGYFTVNVRVSKTIGFGTSKGGGPKGGTPTGGESGIKTLLTDTLTAKAYNLSFSLSVRNLLNRTNLATPTGNLTSPIFGTATSLADTYAPAPGAGNRRVEVQARLKF